MSIRYVTSFSGQGYELYGKEMLEGLLRFWPEGEVYVYSEDFYMLEPKFDAIDGVVYRDLLKVEGLALFLEGIEKLPIAHGRLPQGYNYRYDVWKFCRKMFAQWDAFQDFRGTLVWVDADTYTIQNIPQKWLETWIEGSAMAYLGRKQWHLCASFLMWDCLRRETKVFFDTYIWLLKNNTVLFLPEWHDSFLVQTCIESLRIPANNISGLIEEPGPVNVYDMVFQNRSKHQKGNLKNHPKRYRQLIDLVQSVQPKRILEIGTWNGKRAIEMHDVSLNSYYVGVDLFEDGNQSIDAIENNVKKRCDARQVAMDMIQAGITRFSLYKGFSREKLPEVLDDFGQESMDLVFIDGGHSIATISEDFQWAKQLVSKNGFILLDDYYDGVDTEIWGCNQVVDGIPHEVLPLRDPVKGGGTTQMVLVRSEEL
jgi:predicted O-methyltransferase YrrM